MKLTTILASAVCMAMAAVAPGQKTDFGGGDAMLALKGGTIMPVTGEPIENGVILIQNGRILEIGSADSVTVPGNARTVDTTGKFIMPGIIDTHSHMGVYAWPSVEAHWDGNEMTSPVTAQVKAEDAVHLEDPAFARARGGGVTVALVIPGSGNLIGGEGVVLKLRPKGLLDTMKMAEAPRQIKMAMGENPKRVYGERGQLPSTRMGIVAKLREVFLKASELQAKQQRYKNEQARHERKMEAHRKDLAAGKAKDTDEPEPPTPPDRDPLSETLVDVMEGRIRVQVHCYKKDDMLDMLRVADEFGFKVAAFHHALEGYKLADHLAERGIAAVTWPDWWGFKMEAYDAVPQNMAIMANAGMTVGLHSDSANIGQRLYNEAAKAQKYGMTEQQALESITVNAARVLGIEEWVGSLEAGKHADIAVFSAHPLDAYTRVELTLIDGRVVFDRSVDIEPMETLAGRRMTGDAP